MSGQEDINLKEKVRATSHSPGVYLMKDRFGEIIYIGKAKDLKKRVSTYFQPSRKFVRAQPKLQGLLKMVHDFDVVEVRSEMEALLLEGKLLKEYKPKYNTDFIDDKRFLMVRVDIENPMPRFRLVRNQTEEKSRYFGPFVHSGLLRKTLAEMRRKFGILLHDAKPRQLDSENWILYEDARAELYGHSNEVSTTDYTERVHQACQFLEGKSREWLRELEEEMTQASRKLEFEKAAELRDVIRAMRKTLTPSRKFTREIPLKMSDPEACARLGEILGLEQTPKTMECFDISHISGTFAVASMVHFLDGKPLKRQYRRFKIKSFIGNDDFRAMEEVVGRRYRRLHEEGRPLPDLVVIDGGKGQVTAAVRAFLIQDIPIPPLIGLAKKAETIVFPDERKALNLSFHDPALQLLQRLRDEAHRLANSFNAELRSKKLRESVLEDVPGLGKVRRATLLDSFGSLDKIRNASVEELASIPGIGAKFAKQIHSFFRK